MIFPCYENFNFGMLQPECSNMKANCLQIFVLGALTSVKMWTTRGKNSAKSLTEERKKLGQESGKQETSSHLSWGNNESLGKHTNYNTSRRVHVKKLGPGGIPTGSLLLLPTPGTSFIIKPTGTLLCTFLWVVPKSSKWLSTLWLGSLLWKLYQKIPPRNCKSWWKLFLKISFWHRFI